MVRLSKRKYKISFHTVNLNGLKPQMQIYIPIPQNNYFTSYELYKDKAETANSLKKPRMCFQHKTSKVRPSGWRPDACMQFRTWLESKSSSPRQHKDREGM
jgi:hypothetical protein